jgi:hypothetical protein
MSDTIAEVRSWNDLHAAFRARAESLNVSRLVLDELSGLQSGYASKLLAPVPMRHFGRVSLGAMLGLWDSNWSCKRTRKLLRGSPDG